MTSPGWIVVYDPQERRYYAAMLTDVIEVEGSVQSAGAIPLLLPTKRQHTVYTIQPFMGNFGTSEEARQAYEARTR